MLKKVLLLLAIAGLAIAAEPVKVKGSEQQQKLIHKVVPVYPPEAKQNGVSGTVQLRATIAEAGNIRELKLLTGEQILADAAIEAVRQWVYAPTLLNGEPVAVITDIDVNFVLSK